MTDFNIVRKTFLQTGNELLDPDRTDDVAKIAALIATPAGIERFLQQVHAFDAADILAALTPAQRFPLLSYDRAFMELLRGLSHVRADTAVLGTFFAAHTVAEQLTILTARRAPEAVGRCGALEPALEQMTARERALALALPGVLSSYVERDPSNKERYAQEKAWCSDEERAALPPYRSNLSRACDWIAAMTDDEKTAVLSAPTTIFVFTRTPETLAFFREQFTALTYDQQAVILAEPNVFKELVHEGFVDGATSQFDNYTADQQAKIFSADNALKVLKHLAHFQLEGIVLERLARFTPAQQDQILGGLNNRYGLEQIADRPVAARLLAEHAKRQAPVAAL